MSVYIRNGWPFKCHQLRETAGFKRRSLSSFDLGCRVGRAASTETLGGTGFRLPATLVQHCQLRLCGRL